MKIFKAIQLENSVSTSNPGSLNNPDLTSKAKSMTSPSPTCQNCAHFQNDPALIEAEYRGLTAMSSGFASVRDRDGLCNHHELYLSARDSCPHFEARIAESQ